MSQVQVEGKLRENKGKGVARKLRAVGRIPGVLYGEEIEPMKIDLEEKSMAALMKKHGLNFIVDLKLGDKNYTCMIADFQRDVFQRFLTHIDFKHIDITKEVISKVPVRMAGDGEVRTRGGIAQLYLRDLTVRSLPTAIPKFYELDVSKMRPGQSQRVSDLEAKEGYTILNDDSEVVVNILAPRALAAAAAAAAAEEEAEE